MIPRDGFVAHLHLHKYPGPRDGRGLKANRLSALGTEEVLVNEGERESVGDRPAPSVNNKVAGCGRLRRPSSQPALVHKGLGNSISVGSVAEPGNGVLEAGSATSER